MQQLPKAPEAEAAAAAADAAAREAAERAARQADVAALRALRMGLRDVTTRLLCDRRWRAFAEPVTPEEDPEYLQLVIPVAFRSCPHLRVIEWSCSKESISV